MTYLDGETGGPGLLVKTTEVVAATEVGGTSGTLVVECPGQFSTSGPQLKMVEVVVTERVEVSAGGGWV